MKLSILYVFIHIALATMSLYAFFAKYVKRYMHFHVVMIDLAQTEEIDFAKRTNLHEQIKSEVKTYQIFMAVMSILALWAAVKAATTNPGILQHEYLTCYSKEDLNKKLVKMFKDYRQKDRDASINELDNSSSHNSNQEKLLDDAQKDEFCNKDKDCFVEEQTCKDDTICELKHDKNQHILHTLHYKLGFRNCYKCKTYYEVEESAKQKKLVESKPVLRPQRSHHCMFCDVCVVGIDHHCALLGTCIGKYNKKYFYQYCLYINVISVFIIYRYLQLWFFYKKSSVDFLVDRQWQLIYGFIIAVFAFFITLIVGLINVCGHHLCRGQSKCEYKYKQSNDNQNKLDPFNHGFWENYYFTFGEPGLGWLLPLAPTFYDGNKEIMLKDWGLQKPTDFSESSSTYQGHILGVTMSCISEKFYHWACENIQQAEKHAEQHLEDIHIQEIQQEQQMQQEQQNDPFQDNMNNMQSNH